MRSLVVLAFMGCMHCGVLPLLAQAPANANPPAPAAADANTENVRFVALEEHERRGAVLDIRNRLLFERNEDGKRIRAMAECANAFQMNFQPVDDMQQLEGFVRLWRKAQKILDDLANANGRQIELITLINNADMAGGLLPQVANYLQEAKKQVTELGMRQVNQQKQLRTFLGDLNMAIRNVPPPELFVSDAGITMIRYGQGKQSLYVSEKPIGINQYQAIIQIETAGGGQGVMANDSAAPAKTGVSLAEAEHFAHVLSRLERQTYALPDINQLKLLSLSGYTPSCALWINSPWLPSDYDAERALERFAVSFNVVWDPQRLFANGVTFGELPFARSPKLGFTVVTSTHTGWNLRWQRLMIKMKADNASLPLDVPALPEP